MDTIGKLGRKENLEKELDQVEKDIKKLQKNYIFVDTTAPSSVYWWTHALYDNMTDSKEVKVQEFIYGCSWRVDEGFRLEDASPLATMSEKDSM